MTPTFRILANSQDITNRLEARLLTFSLLDEAGFQSDTLRLSLDNRDGKIAIPETGAELEVWLGYEEAGLSRMGLFVVDEIGIEGPPDTLIISANAANMRASLKEKKSRSWENLTIGDVVATVAQEHGYTPKVGADLAAIRIDHLDQTESDLHFLTRLARNHAATFKPAQGFLLFVPEGEAKSASGKTLPSVTLTREDLSRWSVRSRDREKYGSVRAFWQDPQTQTFWQEAAEGENRSVLAGTEKPEFRLRGMFPNADAAMAAARAKLTAIIRGTATIEFTCPGRTDLLAETPLSLEGVGAGIDGNWIVTRADHELGNRGYTVRCTAKLPK